MDIKIQIIVAAGVLLGLAALKEQISKMQAKDVDAEETAEEEEEAEEVEEAKEEYEDDPQE